MKKPKSGTKKKEKETEERSLEVLDVTPLFKAFREAFEWALDLASAIAREFPEEVAAVERVRTYIRKRIAGDPAKIDQRDILFTFALLMAAIERDLGPLQKRASAKRLPTLLFPGAHDAWEQQFTTGSVRWAWEQLFRCPVTGESHLFPRARA